jgi:hypothetical protein
VRIYSGGDPNVTSRGAVALLQNDTTTISIANRVISIGYITLALPCGEQKQRPAAWRRYLWTGQRQKRKVEIFYGPFYGRAKF